MINIEICIEKTAISNGQCCSCKMIRNREDTKKILLDYGCGRLRNSIYLEKHGFKVYVYDTDFQIKKNKDKIKGNIEYIDRNIKYDVILCSFVLNVIPERKVRIEVLKDIEFLLNENGVAYIEVRKEDFEKAVKYSEKYLDGYLVGKNKIKTFQKSYSMIELENFIKENTMLKKINCISNSNSNVCIIKKLTI